MCVCTPTRQAPAYRVDSVSEMLTFSTPLRDYMKYEKYKNDFFPKIKMYVFVAAVKHPTIGNSPNVFTFFKTQNSRLVGWGSSFIKQIIVFFLVQKISVRRAKGRGMLLEL